MDILCRLKQDESVVTIVLVNKTFIVVVLDRSWVFVLEVEHREMLCHPLIIYYI